MDLNNNLFLYIAAHLITLPGFLITSPRSPPAVLSQLQKINHRVKSKWLRIGFPKSLRGQCVHRRCTEVLLMTWWTRTRQWCQQLRIWRYFFLRSLSLSFLSLINSPLCDPLWLSLQKKVEKHGLYISANQRGLKTRTLLTFGGFAVLVVILVMSFSSITGS